MSNRQARKARKAAQRAGTAVYVHLKPTAATPPEERVIRAVPERFGGDRSFALAPRLSKRHQRRIGLNPDRKDQDA